MQGSHEAAFRERRHQQALFAAEIVDEAVANSEVDAFGRLVKAADMDGRIFAVALKHDPAGAFRGSQVNPGSAVCIKITDGLDGYGFPRVVYNLHLHRAVRKAVVQAQDVDEVGRRTEPAKRDVGLLAGTQGVLKRALRGLVVRIVGRSQPTMVNLRPNTRFNHRCLQAVCPNGIRPILGTDGHRKMRIVKRHCGG